MSSQILLSARGTAYGHERAVPRSVRLDDPNDGDLRMLESLGDLQKRRLSGCDEADGVGAAGQVPRARFASRMNDLCGLEASREIRSNYHVMSEHVCTIGTCPNPTGSKRSGQACFHTSDDEGQLVEWLNHFRLTRKSRRSPEKDEAVAGPSGPKDRSYVAHTWCRTLFEEPSRSADR